ncbi:MAG: BON domain-containing protein [Gemmataceae bacterium]|nr:BON domain-containing protein [Gemmataceae bacterium]
MGKVYKHYLGLAVFLVASFSLASGQNGPLLFPKEVDKKLNPEVAPKNRFRDLELVLKVRKLLAEDKELAPLNIGVSIREGVLFLWGPVPNAKKIQAVLNKVTKVKLIFDVKNEMYLGVVEDIPVELFNPSAVDKTQPP